MKILFLLLLFVLSLQAHKLNENYLYIDYNQTTKELNLSLEVETRLLERESIMDDNHNGIISYKELRHHKKYLTDYVREHFELYNDTKKLSLMNAKTEFHRYQDQTYMKLNKKFSNIDLDRPALHYTMFFELEKNHKLLIHLDENRGDYVLSNTRRDYSFSSFRMSQLERVTIFLKTGIHHILDGTDHLLFILMILMPSVIKGIRISLLDIFKIITTFSIAHSLTLFISGAGLFRPNATFIESSIALSIFIVAWMNFHADYKHVNKKIIFLFGLLHGFGFANVLEIAQVKDTLSFMVALFGFNLGVEVGQIFVILLLLPLLYFISIHAYKTSFIKLVSLAAMITSGFWFLQRVGLF